MNGMANDVVVNEIVVVPVVVVVAAVRDGIVVAPRTVPTEKGCWW